MVESKSIIESKEQTSKISEAILLMMFLLVLNEILLNLFGRLTLRFKRLAIINSSIITTTIGLVAGLLLYQASTDLLLRDLKDGFSQIFLIILLPPILFEGAINMEPRPFFKNFGTINMYAVFGTIIAWFITGSMIFVAGVIGIATSFPLVLSFSYGALISSTDPVAVLNVFKQMRADRDLNALIFGESVLNDAVSLILFDSTIKLYTSETPSLMLSCVNFLMVFVASILIGFVIGVISAYILKNRNSGNDNNTRHMETTIILIVPWVSYLIAEGFDFSGIVSIIFCGISMSRYAEPNFSPNGKRQIHQFYHALAYNFESAIFIFIGIGVIGFQLPWKEMGVGLLVVTFLAISIGRFVNVWGVSKIANFYRKKTLITKEWKIVMWFSGLRGAMAYALSIQSATLFQENNYGNIMLTVTLSIVLINIYFQGTLIQPVMERCKVEQDDIIQDESEQHDTSRLTFNRLKVLCSELEQRFLLGNLIRKVEQEEPIEQDSNSPLEQKQVTITSTVVEERKD